jgi:hypothetical protein
MVAKPSIELDLACLPAIGRRSGAFDDSAWSGRSARRTRHAAHLVGLASGAIGYRCAMNFLLWLIAAILVIAGIVSLFRGAILWGVVLIVVGLLVGPGGVSIFT